MVEDAVVDIAEELDSVDEVPAGPEPRTYTQDEFESAFRRRLSREKRKLADSIRSEVLAEMESKGKSPDADLQRQLDSANGKLARYARLDELVELAEERYEVELAALPEAIRMLAPDDDADIVDKERWLLTKARPAVERLRKEIPAKPERESARKGINPSDPQPKSPDRTAGGVDQLLREARNSPIYRRMI